MRALHGLQLSGAAAAAAAEGFGEAEESSASRGRSAEKGARTSEAEGNKVSGRRLQGAAEEEIEAAEESENVKSMPSSTTCRARGCNGQRDAEGGRGSADA